MAADRSISPLRNYNAADPVDLQRALDDIKERVNAILILALGVDSRIVTRDLSTVDTLIEHHLGRPVTKFVVLALSADAVVREGAKTTAPRSTVNLRSSAPVTAMVLLQ